MKELREWIDTAAKVTLALVGAVVGYYFSFQKQQNDDIKLIVEMATSQEPAKRIMGASIAEAYFSQKRIPQEVYLSVFSYANNSGDKKLQAVVNSGAVTASEEKPNLQQALDKASKSFPIRIYFHIRQETDRESAKNIEKILESSVSPAGNTIVVPGIELVAGTQTASLLKCFKKTECETLGPQLVKIFNDNGIQIKLSDQSAAYEQSASIRPNHFEVWFSQGVQ